jgi:hypothetical protein
MQLLRERGSPDQQGARVGVSQTPITTVMTGSPEKAQELSRRLYEEESIYVQAFSCPVVPKGKDRKRLGNNIIPPCKVPFSSLLSKFLPGVRSACLHLGSIQFTASVSIRLLLTLFLRRWPGCLPGRLKALPSNRHQHYC